MTRVVIIPETAKIILLIFFPLNPVSGTDGSAMDHQLLNKKKKNVTKRTWNETNGKVEEGIEWDPKCTVLVAGEGRLLMEDTWRRCRGATTLYCYVLQCSVEIKWVRFYAGDFFLFSFVCTDYKVQPHRPARVCCIGEFSDQVVRVSITSQIWTVKIKVDKNSDD